MIIMRHTRQKRLLEQMKQFCKVFPLVHGASDRLNTVLAENIQSGTLIFAKIRFAAFQIKQHILQESTFIQHTHS